MDTSNEQFYIEELNNGLKLSGLDPNEVLQELRNRFDHITKQIMWEKYEEGWLHRQGIQFLSNTIQTAQDDLSEPNNIWSSIYKDLISHPILKSLLFLKVIGFFVQRAFQNFFVYTFETISVMIIALDEFYRLEISNPKDLNPKENELEALVFKRIKHEIQLNLHCGRRYSEFLHSSLP